MKPILYSTQSDMFRTMEARKSSIAELKRSLKKKKKRRRRRSQEASK